MMKILISPFIFNGSRTFELMCSISRIAIVIFRDGRGDALSPAAPAHTERRKHFINFAPPILFYHGLMLTFHARRYIFIRFKFIIYMPSLKISRLYIESEYWHTKFLGRFIYQDAETWSNAYNLIHLLIEGGNGWPRTKCPWFMRWYISWFRLINEFELLRDFKPDAGTIWWAMRASSNTACAIDYVSHMLASQISPHHSLPWVDAHGPQQHHRLPAIRAMIFATALANGRHAIIWWGIPQHMPATAKQSLYRL